MKRDWDVIRKILLAVEVLPTEDSTFTSNDLTEVDTQSTAYHMRLLLDAELIVGSCRDALGPPFCQANRLTWAGHKLRVKLTQAKGQVLQCTS